MKLLFLDIDGVLNCVKTVERYRGGVYGIDPKKVELLNQILERSGAKVVISSTWRILTPRLELETYLNNQGFRGEIIGYTPRLAIRYPDSQARRGEEIDDYLADLEKPPAAYVILDDGSDFHAGQPLVRTSFRHGLTRRHVKQALELLSPEMKDPAAEPQGQ